MKMKETRCPECGFRDEVPTYYTFFTCVSCGEEWTEPKREEPVSVFKRKVVSHTEYSIPLSILRAVITVEDEYGKIEAIKLLRAIDKTLLLSEAKALAEQIMGDGVQITDRVLVSSGK